MIRSPYNSMASRKRFKASEFEESDFVQARTIGSVFDAWLASAGLGDIRAIGEISSIWQDVVGPDCALHMKPVSVSKGVLHIVVDHPGWGTELTFMSANILTGLADRLGKSPASSIRVTVGASNDLQ